MGGTPSVTRFSLGEMVAESWLELEQFRLLVLRTAWKIDKYQDYKKIRADISAVKAAAPIVLRNVTSLFLEQSTDRDEVLRAAEDLLLAQSHVQRGDMIVLTIGEPMGKSGGTNTMKIVRVGDHRS